MQLQQQQQQWLTSHLSRYKACECLDLMMQLVLCHSVSTTGMGCMQLPVCWCMQLSPAVADASMLLARVLCLQVQLSSLLFFEHASSYTLWLDAADKTGDSALHMLMNAVLLTFDYWLQSLSASLYELHYTQLNYFSERAQCTINKQSLLKHCTRHSQPPHQQHKHQQLQCSPAVRATQLLQPRQLSFTSCWCDNLCESYTSINSSLCVVLAGLAAVQSALQAAFPACTDLSDDPQRNISGFMPHMSLGQWHNKKQLLSAMQVCYLEQTLRLYACAHVAYWSCRTRCGVCQGFQGLL